MDGFFFDFDVLEDKKALPAKQEDDLPEEDASCWHSGAGDSSADGAKSCRSSYTWQTGLATPAPSEPEDPADHPYSALPRTDTCSSLASSWCSDSEPITPTTAQTTQDRWTPGPASDAPIEGKTTTPVSISVATSRVMRCGTKSCKPKTAWPNPEEEDNEEEDSFLSQLALKVIQTLMPSELVGLICGKDFWHNHGVPRVGIPPIRFTDGPFGARGPTWDGPSSAVTPCGMALGSSWNLELVQQVGLLLGEEARTKGANVLLGPSVNLARLPLSGRNWELMGEDPLLVAKLGVAYIKGVQSVDSMAACVKHLAVNDQEKNRFFVNAIVDTNVLLSQHLLPFEAAVKEGNVMAVMTAYNRVNGIFCSEHKWLIQDVLRSMWGFKGIVVSDWGGTHSTEASLKAGLDMEMPKLPTMFYGDRLQKLLGEGKIAITDVRARATAVLKIMARLGLLRGDLYGITSCGNSSKRNSMACTYSNQKSPGLGFEACRLQNASVAALPKAAPGAHGLSSANRTCMPAPVPTPSFQSMPSMDPGRPKPSPNTNEQQELLRRAAREGVVLLKNNGALPLTTDQRIVVIGPSAASMTVMGGGSATVLTNRSERSLVAQLRALGMKHVTYELGCRTGLFLPTLAPPLLRTKDGRGVLKGEFYDESGRSGSKSPLARAVIQHTEVGNWSGIFYNGPPGKLEANQAWSAVFEGVLTPEVTGPYELGVFASGSCKVFLDGRLVLQYPKMGQAPQAYLALSMVPSEVRKVVHLEAGHQYELKLNWTSLKDGDMFPAQCHLGGCQLVNEDELIEQAVETARKSSAAVVCIGTDHWQECEGRDQVSMELPGRSSELIARVAKANSRTIVALNVGSPKELDPWLDDAAAFVAAWYGGQEAAGGLADALLGVGSGPGGRLPITWPRRMEDTLIGKPPNTRYPGEASRVTYDEGFLLGYRWYNVHKVEPAFVFGHGLTYTMFEYIDFTLPAGDTYQPGESVTAVVTVENLGVRCGMEVIQLYLTRLSEGSGPAYKELGAFAKITLEPGDTVDAQLEVPARILQADSYPAELQLSVGPSSVDVCFSQRITVG